MYVIHIKSFHGYKTLLLPSEEKQNFWVLVVTLIPKGKKISKVGKIPSEADVTNFPVLEKQ